MKSSRRRLDQLKGPRLLSLSQIKLAHIGDAGRQAQVGI
jgi:hypothetical protein